MRKATKAPINHQDEPWPMTLVIPHSIFVLGGSEKYEVREYSGAGMHENRDEMLGGDNFILATSISMFRQPPAMMIAENPLVVISVDDPSGRLGGNKVVIERVADVFGWPPLVTTEHIMQWASDIVGVRVDMGLDGVGVYSGVWITREQVSRLTDTFQPVQQLLAEYYGLADQRAVALESIIADSAKRSAYSLGLTSQLLQ